MYGMSHPNPVQAKSYQLAVTVVKLCRTLHGHREYILSKQLLKSGTSVGANIEEALQGQSRADFISKLSIAQKEAFETHYWLNLIRDSGYLSESETGEAISLSKEVKALLTSIIKKTKQNS